MRRHLRVLVFGRFLIKLEKHIQRGSIVDFSQAFSMTMTMEPMESQEDWKDKIAQFILRMSATSDMLKMEVHAIKRRLSSKRSRITNLLANSICNRNSI